MPNPAAPNPLPASPAPGPVSSPRSRWRAFWDFFVLFSGISTRSNLSRTRRDPVLARGIFLFRPRPRR